MIDYQIIEIEFGTPEYDEAVQLRYEILRRPLGLFYRAEDLALEYDQIHLAYYSPSGLLAAYLNLTPISATEVKMRQVAVASTLQNKGIGGRLVMASEQLARQRGFKKMVLHAREAAVPFYQKLQYNTLGNRFEEVNIPHYKMEKDLV